MLDLAKRLATEAAGLSRPGDSRPETERKPDDSVVTDADHAIQEHIFSAIRAAHPDHALLGEEVTVGGSHTVGPELPEARYCWVVDPLDGTRNYAAGLRVFSTSIAVLDRGRPVLGVVSDHNLGDTYEAVFGSGTKLNGSPIRARNPKPDEDFLVGVPSAKDNISVSVVQAWAAIDGFVCRNLGSTALHMALVSSGALAGAFSKRSKIWDIAAGWLLVSEAGGRVTDIKGADHLPFALDIDHHTDLPFLASSPGMHQYLLETIRAAVC